MRLTKFSDYALRVLVFAASAPHGRRVTIAETAAVYGISQAHLKKVVMKLTHVGFLLGERGRTGGYRLALQPKQINLGAVLRATETDFAMVECLHIDHLCCIQPHCRIPPILSKATAAFLAVLDDHTLADIIPGGPVLPGHLNTEALGRFPETAQDSIDRHV